VKVRVHERFDSALPADDANPYRTGAWRPQVTEYDAWDLDVEGELPDDLEGTYLRNTENPLLEPIATYHPFDGDGMLHSLAFGGGEVTYRNRFVRTDAFLAEREAGESLWAGVAELPASSRREDGWGARPRMKDASSTDIVVHRGIALSSFWMCGDLYRHEPSTLDALGKADFGGRFPAEGVSAHPKVDERTGEMLFFNYGLEAPYMHYGEVGPDGVLQHYRDVELPGPRLPHDMAFTENYAIVCDLPMFWHPELIDAGMYVPSFFPELPSRFGVIPRHGGAAAGGPIQWFEADPTYVLHFVNAYEDGEEIVLDGYFQQSPSLRSQRGASFEENLYRYLDAHAFDARMHRWRFDLRSGRCTEERLGEHVREFGMINGAHAGLRHRFAYSAMPVEGWFGFRGVARFDTETGQEQCFELPDGVYASETAMAPRVGSAAEDDGYLVTITMDLRNDESHCVVLDAADLAAGPVARVRLPERVSSGTHACWAPPGV
jgi:carotenoid cleavage dioxygenase-like enzyme